MNFQDVFMGFIDLIPVAFYTAAIILLQRSLYNKTSKGAFALFSCGTIMVTVAGALKALYKILLTLRICRIEVFSTCFFPMETVGFVLAAVSLIAILCHNQGDGKTMVWTLPAFIFLAYAGNYDDIANWSGSTMLLVGLMCFGVVVFDGILIFYAIKLKKPIIVVTLIISLIFTLGMGYLSTKDSMNDLIKEFVNIIGQGTLFVSALLFHKYGLDDANAKISIK